MSVVRYDYLYDQMEMMPDGPYILYSDYAALQARHDALREAVHKAMNRIAPCDKKQTDAQLIADVAYLNRLASDYFKTSVDCGNRAFAAEQKYDALGEAVEWMLHCHGLHVWAVDHFCLKDAKAMLSDDLACDDVECVYIEARAEVDRLLGEG